MKKFILVWILVVVMVFSLGACGQNNAETPAEEPSEAADTEEPDEAADTEEPAEAADTEESDSDSALVGEGKKLAIMLQNLEDEFLTAIYAAATARAEEYGFEVIFLDAKRDAVTQASQVQDMIVSKVDAIMLAPVDAAALSDSVKLLNEAKIPVTLVDRTVEEGDYVAISESDNYQFGYQAAGLIVEYGEAAGIAVGDLKVLELQGDLASTSGLYRSDGFQAAAEELGLTIVASLPTNWKSDVAYNSLMDGFQANPEINAVFMPSDGVCGDSYVSVLEQLNKLFKAGEDGHIISVGVDGTPGALDYIRDGYIDATCSQPAIAMAQVAIDKLVENIEGKVALDAKEQMQLPPMIATIDNIDSDDLWGNS